jgi:predicted phosphodiesterase
MTSNLQKILIVPDTHRPYHDKRAWKVFMTAAKAFKPDILVCIGDFGDFYSVSRHAKSPDRDRRLKWEVRSVNDGLDELDALGAKRKVFCAGNHCSRMERYIAEKAPELFGMIDIPSLLNLPARKWEYIPYKSHIKIGKIHYTHDVGACGRYAVHKALDYYRKGVVTGHVHRIGLVVEGNLAGDTQISANFGWLGDHRQIDYAQQGKVERDSALGFGIGYMESSGVTYLVPVPIVRYKCCVEGKIYAG